MNNWYQFVLMEFIALFVTIYLIFDDTKPVVYEYAFLLPFGYFFITMMFNKVFFMNRNNFGCFFLLALLFFRNVIIPLMMSLGNYNTVIAMIDYGAVFKSVLLLLYEMFCILLILYFILHRHKKSEKDSNLKRNYRYFDIALMFIFVFLIASYFTYPNIGEMYRNIFDINTAEFTKAGYSYSIELESGSIDRYVFTLFSSLLEVARFFIPIRLMEIAQKNNKNKLVILILLLSIGFQLLFFSATIARTFLITMILLFYLGILYPRHYKRIVLLCTSFFGILVIAYFVLRFTVFAQFSIDALMEHMSMTFVEYFTALPNVAATFNMPTSYAFETFSKDIISGIPLSKFLLNGNEIGIIELYNYSNGTQGQIPPTIGNGYFHFGFIGAPIYSICISYLSLKAGEIAWQSKIPVVKLSYLFFSIVFAMSVVMYNETICFNWTVNLMLPMVIMHKFIMKE